MFANANKMPFQYGWIFTTNSSQRIKDKLPSAFKNQAVQVQSYPAPRAECTSSTDLTRDRPSYYITDPIESENLALAAAGFLRSSWKIVLMRRPNEDSSAKHLACWIAAIDITRSCPLLLPSARADCLKMAMDPIHEFHRVYLPQ